MTLEAVDQIILRDLMDSIHGACGDTCFLVISGHLTYQPVHGRLRREQTSLFLIFLVLSVDQDYDNINIHTPCYKYRLTSAPTYVGRLFPFPFCSFFLFFLGILALLPPLRVQGFLRATPGIFMRFFRGGILYLLSLLRCLLLKWLGLGHRSGQCATLELPGLEAVTHRLTSHTRKAGTRIFSQTASVTRKKAFSVQSDVDCSVKNEEQSPSLCSDGESSTCTHNRVPH